jgi:hypothetical protein
MDRLSELLPAGPPISEAQQIGRGAFIGSVEERLRSGDVLIFADARRVGKTSVARASLARIERAGGAIAEVNLAAHGKDHLGAASALATKLAGGLGRQARRVGATAKRLRRAGAGEATGPDGAAVLAMTAELLGASRRIDSVITRAAARRNGRICAILLDEAHVIAEWPDDVQQALNVALRDSGPVGVIVASSERRAVERLLDDGQALHMAGYPMGLPEIDTRTWTEGLEARFAALGAEVRPASLEAMVAAAHHHPYCTMRLAAESALQAEQERQIKNDARVVIDELAIAAALVVVRADPVWKAVIG